jgi:hypothetical protein
MYEHECESMMTTSISSKLIQTHRGSFIHSLIQRIDPTTHRLSHRLHIYGYGYY